MNKKMKKQLDWALDKLNDVALGGYGLLTAELWLKLVTVGAITTPEGARLVGLTMVLAVVWAVIGHLKGQLED